MATIYDQLVQHLGKHEHVTKLTTCQVAIGRTTYPAALYTECCEVQPGCRAYTEGKRAYTREMIYCVGNLPSAKLRGNVAFNLPTDATDWYVAAYYGNVVNRRQETAEPNEFHPFGNSFILAPWDIADSKIDQYERHPYRRVPMVIRNEVARKGSFV